MGKDTLPSLRTKKFFLIKSFLNLFKKVNLIYTKVYVKQILSANRLKYVLYLS